MADDAEIIRINDHSIPVSRAESNQIEDNPIYQLAGKNEKSKSKPISTERLEKKNPSEIDRQLNKERQFKSNNLRDRTKNNNFNEMDKKNLPRDQTSTRNKTQDSRYDKNKAKKKNRKDSSTSSRQKEAKIKDEEKEREKTITEILYRRFAQNQSNNNTDCASQGSTNSNYPNQLTDAIKSRQTAGNEYDAVSSASMHTEMKEKQVNKVSNISMNKDFIACLNVSKFKPEEIKAKIVNDSIFVEGSHEERLEENGVIARTFSRKYVIPDGFDPTKIQITMYKDKILKIKVPAPTVATGPVRVIPIQHRNENAIIKKNKPEIRNQ